MLGITRQVGVNRIRPGIIRFYWKVSSQLGGDYLEFFIDSVRQGRISGTTDWQRCGFHSRGSGVESQLLTIGFLCCNCCREAFLGPKGME